MDKSSILSGFNKHYFEFAQEISNYFPENMDVKTSINVLHGIKKINPKLIIKMWQKYVVEPYKKQIENEDFEFFLNKDYASDVNFEQNDRVLQGIENMRKPIAEMSKENQQKCMQYVKNLTTLSMYYFN